VSEGVGDVAVDGNGLTTGGVIVGRIEVMRVWNRRGVIVVETGVVTGLAVAVGGCLADDTNGVVEGVEVIDEGGGAVVVGGCLADDTNGVVEGVMVIDKGGGAGIVGVGSAVTTGSSVSSGS